MFYHMEMIARDRQEKLLREAADERMQRAAVGRGRPTVHPVRRATRPALGHR